MTTTRRKTHFTQNKDERHCPPILPACHPRTALGLNVVAVVERVSSLDSFQNRIKELLVKSLRLARRAGSSEEIVVRSVVCEVTDGFLMRNINGLQTERLRHDHPMIRCGVALSWYGWVLVKECAVHAKVMESFDHDKCQVRVRINLDASTVDVNGVPVPFHRFTHALSGVPIPGKLLDKGLPSVGPIDETRAKENRHK